MLYKNWPEICKVGNVHFRLAVALATDNEFLGKIAQVFPVLFTDTKPDHPGPFPLSYLREVVKKYIENEIDYSDGGANLRLIGFPSVLMGCRGGEEEYELYFSPDFYETEFPKLLKIADEKGYFPFHLHEVVIDGVNYYLGVVLEDYKDVVLFPVSLVDIEA